MYALSAAPNRAVRRVAVAEKRERRKKAMITPIPLIPAQVASVVFLWTPPLLRRGLMLDNVLVTAEF